MSSRLLTLRKYCIACFEIRDLKAVTRNFYLCLECDQSLRAIRLGTMRDFEGLSLLSLFRYESLVKDLILRAKIKGDFSALCFLAELFARETSGVMGLYWGRHVIDHPIDNVIDHVIPAPSSLWGRLRGRFDIAYHCAHELARDRVIPLKRAPWPLHWRYKKQALQTGIRSYPQMKLKPLFIHKPIHRSIHSGLFVDDILTSGQTLETLVRCYSWKKAWAVVLAKS